MRAPRFWSGDNSRHRGGCPPPKPTKCSALHRMSHALARPARHGRQGLPTGESAANANQPIAELLQGRRTSWRMRRSSCVCQLLYPEQSSDRQSSTPLSSLRQGSQMPASSSRHPGKPARSAPLELVWPGRVCGGRATQGLRHAQLHVCMHAQAPIMDAMIPQHSKVLALQWKQGTGCASAQASLASRRASWHGQVYTITAA